MQDLLEFLGPVRRDVLLALKERTTATAPEVAEAAYLSIAAARAQLLVLERAGLVVYDRRRTGVGRPTHVYRLSDQGEALFPQCYSALFRLLLARTSRDPESREAMWQLVAEVQRSQFAAVPPESPERRVEHIVEVLERKGFAPSVEARDRREWRLNLRHCPMIELAKDFPEVCRIERRVLADVAGDGARVTHLQHRLKGDSHCVAVVQLADDPASQS